MRKVSKKWLLGGACLALMLVAAFQVFGDPEETTETNSIKIVALGDSLTYGVGDPTRTGYIGVVRNNIEEQTGRKVVLNNFGISGQRSDQLVNQLNNGVVLRAIKDADYVFLFIGTNDFRKAANWNFRQLPEKPLLLGKEKLRKNILTATNVVRKNNSFAQIYVLGLYNPYFGEKYDPNAASIIKSWNEMIFEASKGSTLTKYVSTYELFENVEKTMYFSDSLHPNTKGYVRLGNWVTKQWTP